MMMISQFFSASHWPLGLETLAGVHASMKIDSFEDLFLIISSSSANRLSIHLSNSNSTGY